MSDLVPYRGANRWRFAAEGNLQELQMLRDDVLQLCSEVGLPWDETLAQAEVVARLAAARGEPTDILSLAVILLLRADYFDNTGDIELCAANDHLNAGSQEHFETCLERGKVAKDRFEAYRDEAHSLYPAVVNGTDPDAAAVLVSALSSRADNGNDDALTTLQSLMDGLPKERLAAFKSALRKLEQGIDA